MADKQFYATGDFRYGTRMLRAGDGPITMNAPTARLYAALGKITTAKPKAATLTPDTPTPAIAAAPKPAAPKAPAKPRKRAKKAAAKK